MTVRAVARAGLPGLLGTSTASGAPPPRPAEASPPPPGLDDGFGYGLARSS